CGYPLDRLWATNSFSVLLNDPSLGSAWLLLDDGETAGYAVLTVRFIMEHGGCNAFVDDLFVRSRHRRRGVGRDAMTALIGECKRCGVRCTLKSDPIMHRPTRFTALRPCAAPRPSPAADRQFQITPRGPADFRRSVILVVVFPSNHGKG